MEDDNRLPDDYIMLKYDRRQEWYIIFPVKVIKSLQGLIRQKYGSSGNVEYNPSDQLVVAYGGAKRKRSSRKSRRRM